MCSTINNFYHFRYTFLSLKFKSFRVLGFFGNTQKRKHLSSMSLEAANNSTLSVIWNTKSDLHYFKRWIQTDKHEQIKGNKVFNCTPYATSYSRVCWNSGHFWSSYNLWDPPTVLGGCYHFLA